MLISSRGPLARQAAPLQARWSSGSRVVATLALFSLALAARVYSLSGFSLECVGYLVAGGFMLPWALPFWGTLELRENALRVRRYAWSRWVTLPLSTIQRVVASANRVIIRADEGTLTGVRVVRRKHLLVFLEELETKLGADRVELSALRSLSWHSPRLLALAFPICWLLSMSSLRECFGWQSGPPVRGHQSIGSVALSPRGDLLTLAGPILSGERSVVLWDASESKWSASAYAPPAPLSVSGTERLLLDSAERPLIVDRGRVQRWERDRWTAYGIPQGSESSVVVSGERLFALRPLPAGPELYELEWRLQAIRPFDLPAQDGVLPRPLIISAVDGTAIVAAELEKPGAGRTLAVFRLEQSTWRELDYGPRVPSPATVHSAFSSARGELWFATEDPSGRAALLVLAPAEKRARTYGLDPLSRDELSAPTPLRSFVVDTRNRIWVQSGSEVLVFEPEDDGVARLLTRYHRRNSNVDAYAELRLARDGQVWTHTWLRAQWVDARAASLPWTLPIGRSAQWPSMVDYLRTLGLLVVVIFGAVSPLHWLKRVTLRLRRLRT
jgi:hypothetical protein